MTLAIYDWKMSYFGENKSFYETSVVTKIAYKILLYFQIKYKPIMASTGTDKLLSISGEACRVRHAGFCCV